MHRTPLLLVLALLGTPLAAQTSRAVAVELPALPKSRYFRIDPQNGTKTPAAGFGLLVVLPGGPGTADFLPWVENGIVAQLPKDFVGVMLTAPKWTENQAIVWPTEQDKVVGMRYGTEAYVRAVVADVQKAQVIDEKRRYVLAWSSSGPAVYQLLLSDDSPFVGAYIAMSVFRGLGKQARRVHGIRFVLDQSPEDRITKFTFAERAQTELTAAGGIVRLLTYQGGHGWLDDPQARLRSGLQWLLGNEPAPPAAAALQTTGANLLRNGDFEADTDDWQVLGNSGTMRAEIDRDAAVGKGALHLKKTGKLPLDLVRQELRKLGGATTLIASCQVKCKDCRSAFVKFFLYDALDRIVHEDVDLVHLHGDQDWQQVQKSYEVGKATYGVFQIVMVQGGEVWVDDARVAAAAPAPANK